MATSHTSHVVTAAIVALVVASVAIVADVWVGFDYARCFGVAEYLVVLSDNLSWCSFILHSVVTWVDDCSIGSERKRGDGDEFGEHLGDCGRHERGNYLFIVQSLSTINIPPLVPFRYEIMIERDGNSETDRVEDTDSKILSRISRLSQLEISLHIEHEQSSSRCTPQPANYLTFCRQSLTANSGTDHEVYQST